MHDQRDMEDKGGTIRLGLYVASIAGADGREPTLQQRVEAFAGAEVEPDREIVAVSG
jgi:hypothetical protein